MTLPRRLSPLFALLLMVGLVLPVAPTQARVRVDQPPLEPGVAAELGRALENGLAEQGVPGAVLFVHVPGRAPWVGAGGLANTATGAAMTPQHRLRVASLTKSFVAVVALQLVQEGWLNLDQTVEHWLPGLVPGGERISVRHLMSHTSGLPEYMSDGFVGRARLVPDKVWAPRELVAEALKRPMLFAPGAPGRWAYANTNYILLGLIVEQVTRNPLERELQQRVIGPLGLRATSMAPPNADPGDLARGYVGGQDYTALNMSFAWAAGGMISSAEDVGRFARALYGGELLRPETLALMETYQSTHGVWGIPDLSYGLGLMQRTIVAGGPGASRVLVSGHTGALAGYRAVMWRLPQSGITIVALLNRYESDPNRLAGRALEALIAQGVPVERRP